MSHLSSSTDFKQGAYALAAFSASELLQLGKFWFTQLEMGVPSGDVRTIKNPLAIFSSQRTGCGLARICATWVQRQHLHLSCLYNLVPQTPGCFLLGLQCKAEVLLCFIGCKICRKVSESYRGADLATPPALTRPALIVELMLLSDGRAVTEE